MQEEVTSKTIALAIKTAKLDGKVLQAALRQFMQLLLVIYGRMIQIYLVTSLGPIPLSTMANSEWRSVGQNYLKSLLALAFQAFLIMVCVGIYAVLIQTIGAGGDISGAIWRAMGYTVLLSFCLFKTGSMANV